MNKDFAQIRNHYAKMDDMRLEYIAKFEIGLLEPDIQSIVIYEIQRRGLDKNLLIGIEAQKKPLSPEEILELVKKIKGLTCPACGKASQGIVGGIIRKVRSYILFTHYETKPMIACQSCVDAERKNQLIKNCLLGWWGIPSGLVYRTPQAIIGHIRDNGRKNAISESILAHFAIENVGEIKTNWDREVKIVDFIHLKNNAPPSQV